MDSKRGARPSSTAVIWTAVVLAMFLALQSRVVPVLNLYGPGSLILELGLGAVLVVLVVRQLRRTVRPAYAWAVAVAVIVVLVYAANWSLLAPRAYFLLHRPEFAQVGALVRSGAVGDSDEYYGERLPWPLRRLSVDGNASAVGIRPPDGAREPVAVFLPQWFGIPDDAGGYVYFDGEPPPDMVVDLYGRPLKLADAEPLGGGWWWAG